MVKEKRTQQAIKKIPFGVFFYIGASVALIPLIFAVSFLFQFEKTYSAKIYPGVAIDKIQFGGKTQDEVFKYFQDKNRVFENKDILLTYEDKTATISASELKAGYDSQLSAIQAYSVGRSGNILSDIYQKFLARKSGVALTSVLTFDHTYVDETINYLAEIIDVPAENGLFNFSEGRVKLFKPSKNGLELNKEKTKEEISEYLAKISEEGETDQIKSIQLPVEVILPSIPTEKANNFGIKELIGEGKSKFAGSIAGRIHNIQLAASRISGRLIPPASTFSFNDALGDVSAATGFQPAYIIKEGRTVLGDGGGVCQVSTTIFRAALNAGLSIEERRAHAYRVSYYEQDSAPGIDATVFAPSVDLKFKNDTPAYILIQAETDTANKTLTFSLYGTSDGRRAEITKPVILSTVPPPPDLYQDDPTLPKGEVKQVDWKAWGAKVNFDYKVTRGGETVFEKSFFSNFQPWQAVFLRGTKE